MPHRLRHLITNNGRRHCLFVLLFLVNDLC